MIHLTSAQARKIILHAAGLSKYAQFGKGKEAVYKAIDHLGFIQIDTNYVVERAHHHSLAARVPNYQLQWPDELMAEGRIFEYWTYATGYIPVKDFRFSLPIKAAFAERWNEQSSAEINLMRKVMDRIGREGPLMARDFENDRVTKSTGWWDWRPSKRALEHLQLTGQLMVTRKGNFQKVFDLTENVIPTDTDTTPPDASEYARHVIRRALKAMGIAYMKEIVFTTRYVKNVVKEEMQKMISEGEVCEVAVEGLKSQPLYMLKEYNKKKIIITGDAFILSPFDVLNVFRHRLRDFFDFDYQVECFVPAAKRKYGYFSLPVLIGDTFVARMDSKADRKIKMLTINNLYFEKVKITRAMIKKIIAAIKDFARFNQCIKIKIIKSNNKEVLKAIKNIS